MRPFHAFVPLFLIALTVPAQAQANPADQISNSIFGPRHPVDYAFGAFQRGYYLTALELALPRAEQGDAAAQTLIAEIYARGLGVVQNAERAAGWYQLASNNGDRLATFELGMLYQSGIGVPPNRQRAAELFKASAEAGYIPAKYNLALLHVEGIYAEPSLTTAAALMKEAADAQMPEALYDYGAMLLEGAGVVPDATEGARYMRLAAEEGLADAQVDYATLLYLGQGVEQDIAEAARWYGIAAEAGNVVAQNRYAKLLAVGEGVRLNLEESAMWRALSRRQGLNDPDLDRLLVSIQPEALARAEERARFWPSPPPGTNTAASAHAPSGPVLPIPTDAANAPSQVSEPNSGADLQEQGEADPGTADDSDDGAGAETPAQDP
jgi:TPR repeat protein